MLSRVAESVFWMARYMERTNGLLRLLRTNYVATQNEMVNFNWRTIMQTYGNLDEDKIQEMQCNSRKVLHYVMLDKDNDASLINNITRSRENARAVQDHITKEMWQTLNSYYLLIRENYIEELILFGDPITALDSLIKHGLFLYGTVDITMAREEPYNYLNIGRYLERAIISTDVLNIKLKEFDYDIANNADSTHWRYLLYCLSGYELYIKTNRSIMQFDRVAQQIMFSPHFAHAVMYCLLQVDRYFKRLFSDSITESYERLDYLIGKTINHLKYGNKPYNDGEAIRAMLLQTKSNIFEVASGFNQYYFGKQ
jgi:uncharacterized alpha-E superfamily protein